MFKKEIYKSRRLQLIKSMESGLVLLPGNPQLPFTGPDCLFPFRQDSNFLYFTGIDRPDSLCLLDCDSGEEFLIGYQEENDSSFWDGITPNLSDFAKKSDVDKTINFKDLESILQKSQSDNRKIHFVPPYLADTTLKLHQLLNLPVNSISSHASTELIKAIIELRSVKDEFEIKEMEKATDIAGRMHSTAMIMAMPGAYEQEIKGVIEGIAISNGGRISFNPIVTTRGDILHNPSYANTLESGRLLVVDAGAETSLHYASDITRTTPVGRTFNRQQRNIYEIVLNASEKAIEEVKPGTPFIDIHLKTALEITKGLKDLGIMKGDPEEAVQQGAHALFFPHGLGHMIGLDVHDMDSLGEDHVGYDETFKRSEQFGLNRLRLAKRLKAGNTLTIEPGIYFVNSLIDEWKKKKINEQFINYNQVELFIGMGGIRIEDNILVNESSAQILGKPIAKSIKEVETLI